MTTAQQVRYAAVLLNGAKDVLTHFAIDLRKSDFEVGRPNANVLCIDDVSEEELLHIQAEADNRGCYVESVRGKILVEAEPQIKKAENTSIEDGTWYFAENLEDTYPFVYVRSRRTEAMDRMGLSPEQIVVLQLELLDGQGSTPRKLQADSRKVADFGLRPAVEEDFEAWDLPIPSEVHLRARMEEKRDEKKEASGEPDLRRLANFKEM